MAITDKEQGVWDLDEVYNKQNQGGIWSYDAPSALYVWGSGEKGYNAQNNNAQRSSPLQIPGDWTKMKPYHDSPVVGAIKSDGTLWMWGRNYEGALGLNCSYTGGSCPVNSKSSPTQVPSVGGFNTWNAIATGKDECIAIKSDGTLHGWGRNQAGGLGLNSQGQALSRATQVGTDTTWSDVTMGDYAAMALKSDNTLWVWGENENPTCLGLNDETDRSSPTQLPGSWASMNKGFRYLNAAIKTDGTLWTWGANDDGPLGLNNLTKYSSPMQVGGTNWSQVDVGDSQSVAIKTDGTLWTWGKNEYGELGLGGTSNQHKSSPTQVGTSTNWYSVAISSIFTMASKTDGTVWTWGMSNQGNLGLNQPQGTIVKTPVQVGALSAWTEVNIGGEANTAFAFLKQ